jgi:hypothetical protein
MLGVPAFVFLALFFGLIAVGGIYFNVTGRRWPKAERIECVLARLNSNI